MISFSLYVWLFSFKAWPVSQAAGLNACNRNLGRFISQVLTCSDVSIVKEDLLINSRESDPALMFTFYSVRRCLLRYGEFEAGNIINM